MIEKIKKEGINPHDGDLILRKTNQHELHSSIVASYRYVSFETI